MWRNTVNALINQRALKKNNMRQKKIIY